MNSNFFPNVFGSTIPEFHCLPMIHKPELAFRPIISSINAPTTMLSGFVTVSRKVIRTKTAVTILGIHLNLLDL